MKIKNDHWNRPPDPRIFARIFKLLMKGMNNICSINQKWVREPSPDPFSPLFREFLELYVLLHIFLRDDSPVIDVKRQTAK